MPSATKEAEKAVKALEAEDKDLTKMKGEQRLVAKVRDFLASEVIRREEWERKAYVNVMMKEGNHWVNDEGSHDNRDPNQLRRHVNKFKAVGRGLKNGIAYNDPIVEVFPDNGENVDIRELDLANAIIRNEFNMAGEEGEGMKDLIRTVIDEGAHKGFCVVSVMPNDDNESNRINDIRVHDSFDVFFDNHALSKAQIGVISSYEDRAWLREQGFVNLPSAQATSYVRSHSALKNEFERQHGRETETETNKVLVDNVYYIKHAVDKDGQPIPGKAKVMNAVFAGETIIRAPEELTGFKHLGQLFFMYMMERSKFVKYPTPWMTEIVPLQRSLNDASENIDTIIHWIAKVRLMQRAGVQNTVQLIGDRHVQKIRYEGEKPSFMEFPQIPQDLFRQVQMRESQIEDMAGVHASSMGKSSGDRVSGRKEAVLAAGDADNVAEPVRNLEVFLSRIFGQVLENAADNMTKVMKITGAEGQVYEAVGADTLKKMKSKEKKKNLVPVKPFKNIRVTIIPGSNALIAQGRQETIQLYQFALNAGQTEQAEVLFEVLMRYYASGASRDIMKLIEAKKEQNDADNADMVIAKGEIDKMARGEPVTATPEQPHELHTQLKLTALQTLVERGTIQKSPDDPVFQTFMRNIGQHQSMMQGGEKMGVETIIKGVK